MSRFDLHVSKRWRFPFPDTRVTWRGLSESNSLNCVQDFVSKCLGILTLDFFFLKKIGASYIFTCVIADTASAACPAHPGSLEILSMTFAAVICDGNDPCTVNTAYDTESFFTMSPRSTTLPLYF